MVFIQPDSLIDRYIGSVLLEPRSLFLMRDQMYTDYLHGIKEQKSDVVTESFLNIDRCTANIGDNLERGTRISFTIRFVPKVLKTKIFLPGITGKRK